MAPYHIRKYQESDRKTVLALFSQGMAEHVPTTFLHTLKLPRTFVLLLGGPLALFLVSGSWLLALMASLTLLAALWFLAKYCWTLFLVVSLQTDLSDITKSYFSERGSYFWVVEAEGQVVGMVGALRIKEPTLEKGQLELLRLSVALEHRGQGIAKALVRTVLQFARDQGYSEVVLTTTILQSSALALYQSMGFQKTQQFFFSMWCRLTAAPSIRLTYLLPSAQVSQAPGQGGGL
ncbi:PREDICTED: putative N-acetyltransferase 8B isoform X2 [Ceratotherium simum simum]|nr:PREDICTED: putative N-acetyltransferase 8B isoform X2 [Ceratotherium simum simum]XP_014646907.1 PREDICTED: putative N-acetyltransferase 8B isoform X2 [Ceratotherium simum simum]